MKFLSQIWHATQRSEALRQSAILIIGTSLTGVIMAGAMILASRALGPEKFGVFSVSIAIMGLLSKGLDLGLNQLIPRLLNKWYRHPEKAQEFLGHVLLWKLRLISVTIVLGLALMPFIMSFFSYPHQDMVLWSLFGALAMGMYEYVYLVLTAQHKFFQASLMSLGQAVLKALGFSLIFLLGLSSLNGIAFFYYGAPLLGAGVFAWMERRGMWAQPKAAGQEVQNEIQLFLWHAMIGTLAMTLIANLDLLLVQRYLNVFETGLYAGASRIAAFISFATSSVGGVLNNRVSRYHDRETLQRYLLKSSALIALAVLGFLIYLPLAKLSLLWTIGPEYLGGLSALIILVLNAFLSFAIVPFISFFYSVDHPRYFSFGGILQVTIILFGNVFFLPEYGITAAAWTKVAATSAFGLYTAVYVWYALKKVRSNNVC